MERQLIELTGSAEEIAALKRRVAAPPPPSPPRAPRIPPLLSRRRRGADAAAERAVADLWRRRCPGDAMAAPDFAAYAAECCELPSTIGAVLAGRLARRDGEDRAVVRLGDWLGHWREVLGREDDARLRLFAALSGERDAVGLRPAAFSPLLDALLAHHAVMTAAMKAKQAVEPSASAALKHAVEDAVKMYVPL